MNGTLARRTPMMALTAALVCVVAAFAPTATAGEAETASATAPELATADAAMWRADIAGTAWYTEARSGKLVVLADRTVSGTEMAKLKRVVKVPAGALEINRTPSTLRTHIAGGEAITSGGARCTLGFNVESGDGTKYAVTAGHCTNVGGSWSIGTTAASSFPGNDYGLIHHADQNAADGRVSLHNGSYQDVTSAGEAHGGQAVCVSGSSSGVRCGTVVGLNVTVNYPEGIVDGLGQIDICSMPGDSGAPVFAGSIAIGILSGGTGNCSSGGTTYFQPVTEPLAAYGVDVF